ncbi:hypothetical protein G9A89_023220 [Geosiphon pyriformis]|nr:hypothetical protein G9A89_023220 [Geosiphon pyriformis]
MINFLFIFLNLANAVVSCNVFDVGKFFNTDHQVISVSVSLGGLLDTRLNSVCKQANRDQWKFDFKGVIEAKWKKFGIATSANAVMFLNEFATSIRLELLVSKIVKASCEGCVANFDSLIKCWVSLNNVRASAVQVIVNSGADSGHVCSAFFGAKRAYHMSKLAKSLKTKKTAVRAAIDKRIESFKVNKDHTIKSVLKQLFHKVVLNHLVVGNELILEPDLVKSKVDVIMKGWTRKCQVVDDVFAFFGVMSSIEFKKLFGVVSSLPDGKAAGFLGISNEFWKHCDKAVLDMLLVLLNSCLSSEFTAHKILSKILFDRIFLVCSAFDVLREDNFSVLKGITTQSPIFAIGSVIEDALEKNWELWLVLQDMRKAYNSIRWEHLKKSLIRIKMCSKFICFFSSIYRNRTNRVITDFGLMGGYWVHDGLNQEEVFLPLLWCIFYDPLLYEIKHQKSMYRYRLNSYFISKSGHTDSKAGLTSFFAADTFINDISINNVKTVAIPINSRISNLSLFISGSPIFIARKGEAHWYLGIFFRLRTHSNVHFFTNLVLRKTVSNKQFLYLVLAVFYPIVSYRTQFSFVSVGLKLKSGLPFDFPNNTIHYSLFYNLKSFLQIQSKSKVALLISFVNSGGILGHLFSHWAHDFGSLANSFRFHGGVPMSVVLDESRFVKFLSSLWHYGIAFKRLDPCGSVLEWFKLSAAFLNNAFLSPTCPLAVCSSSSLDILGSVCDQFSRVDNSILSVYIDGSIKNLGTVSYRAGAAAFFEDIGLGLDVGVSGLMFYTLAELQAIVLALECAPLSNTIYLFSDSQFALDACRSELGLVCPDFHNQCWMKGHSGVLGNEHANMIAGAASLLNWCLLSHLDEHFIVADYGVVSGNSRHFVRNIYWFICHACWEISSGSKFLKDSLQFDVDWVCSSLVCHSDLHMAASFTSQFSANAYMYFMKALHYCLPVAVQKYLYKRLYPSVLCLYCGNVEMSDHAFSCKVDESACRQLLDSHANTWKALSGFTYSSSTVFSSVSVALFKGFVFNGWFHEAVSIFHNPKVAGVKVVKFVHSLSMAFRDNIWLVRTKHHAYMERNGLILFDSLVPISVSGLALGLSVGVLKLLGITDAFGVCFGFRKFCSFFLGVNDSVSVYIAV